MVQERPTSDYGSSIHFLVSFQLPGGGNAIGIFPINDPSFNQFRSAVANASISYFRVKDTEGDVGAVLVAADLFQIELDPRQIINAVVLSGYLISQQSELVNMSYHVSVLERMNQNPPTQPPILIAPGGWTGKYNLLVPSGSVGPLLRSGIPQN
jgi:hypothetical protein